MIVVPLIVLVTLLLIWSNQNAKSFGFLWNYFAWANQMLAAFSLGIGTVYLVSQKKPCIITVLPGMFITAVVTCYILWISKEHGGPVGLGIGLTEAYIGSAFIAVLIYIAAYSHGLAMQKKNALITESPKQ